MRKTQNRRRRSRRRRQLRSLENDAIVLHTTTYIHHINESRFFIPFYRNDPLAQWLARSLGMRTVPGSRLGESSNSFYELIHTSQHVHEICVSS